MGSLLGASINAAERRSLGQGGYRQLNVWAAEAAAKVRGSRQHKQDCGGSNGSRQVDGQVGEDASRLGPRQCWAGCRLAAAGGEMGICHRTRHTAFGRTGKRQIPQSELLLKCRGNQCMNGKEALGKHQKQRLASVKPSVGQGRRSGVLWVVNHNERTL